MKEEELMQEILAMKQEIAELKRQNNHHGFNIASKIRNQLSKRVLIPFGIVFFLIATTFAFAATIPNSFVTGDPISSSQMNENFSYIINRLWEVTGANLHYSEGNVGIGTTSPASSLEVQGTGITLGGVTRTTWPTGDGIGAFTDSGTEAYYLGGNVGIGTTPETGSLLHVSSGTSGDAVMILEADTDNNGEDDNPYIEFRQDGGTKSCIGRSGATDGYYTDQIANSFYMYNTSVGAGIQFATGSTPASRMYIDQTGNVGIGTTSPTEKLEVSGNLKVTGSFIGSADYIWIQDEKTSGTTSGTCTPGTWAKRNLTIEKSDTGGHATLSSDQIVLVAGTYHVRASAIGYRTNRHQARLYNATDASTIIVGSSEYSDSGGAVSNRSSIIGQFTLSVSKTLELQHRCQVNSATTDFGQPTSFGESEVYAIIELWRIAN